MTTTLFKRAAWPTFPSVRKWDNLSLRIVVWHVQVIATREDYEDLENAGRNSGFGASGWREQYKTTELPITGSDGESSPKPS